MDDDNMRLICEINDETLLGRKGTWATAELRIAARAILRNADGQYALMYMAAMGLYCLPGGGVESGETVLEAMHREVLEETGCHCETVTPIGYIEENRGYLNKRQLSYYFAATTSGEPEELKLTEVEKENRTQLIWCSFDELLRRLRTPGYGTVKMRFIRAREVAAAEEYGKMFPGD